MHRITRTALLAPVVVAALVTPASANPVGVGSCTVNGTLSTCVYTGDPGNRSLTLTVNSSSYVTQTWRAELTCAPGGPVGLTLQITRNTPGSTTRTSSFFRTAPSACVLRIQQVTGTSFSSGSATAN